MSFTCMSAYVVNGMMLAANNVYAITVFFIDLFPILYVYLSDLI